MAASTPLTVAELALQALALPNARILITGRTWSAANARLSAIEKALPAQAISKVTRPNGNASIRLVNGASIVAVSRIGRGCRGYSADIVVIDGLTTEEELIELLPALSASDGHLATLVP